MESLTAAVTSRASSAAGPFADVPRGRSGEPVTGGTAVLVASEPARPAARRLGHDLGYVSDETVCVDPRNLGIAPCPSRCRWCAGPGEPRSRSLPDDLGLRPLRRPQGCGHCCCSSAILRRSTRTSRTPAPGDRAGHPGPTSRHCPRCPAPAHAGAYSRRVRRVRACATARSTTSPRTSTASPPFRRSHERPRPLRGPQRSRPASASRTARPAARPTPPPGRPRGEPTGTGERAAS
ncbi:hypothetical protein QJS66_07720 [Kocuria rhizophila]|nr:hypothetical protein QJS66_07720 [Kocuria rhizophila]